MTDVVTIGSLAASGVAIAFAALTWLESRKQRELLEILAKTLPFVARPRRRRPTKVSNTSAASKAATEERRRLKLELEHERLEWRKNRDIAKAISWFVDRMGEDEYDEE